MTDHPTDSATVTASEAAPEPPAAAAPAAAALAVAAPRPGVPVWRVGKPDAVLAAAVDAARSAVRDIAADEDIGPHAAVRSEGVRTVTHLFECRLPGYAGWQWFATLTRVSRSKDATVNEVGLLPTNGSVLAPPWVPWADRVRPEDAKAGEPEESAAGDSDRGAAGEDSGMPGAGAREDDSEI
ncbi:hypothetical protein B5P43_17145 [Bacillus sp. SRB_336]|nr:hypothetical protein B5P43_17145 [Bacillus sp. SRB_336]